jgi:hypothetical protein
MTKAKYTEEELKGKKFGHITALEKINKKLTDGTNRVFWLCQCECGKTLERRQSELYARDKHSCGCKHPRHIGGSANKMWCGVGELNSTYFSEIRCRSKRLGIEFNVTIEYLWDLFLIQDKKCALTGLPLRFETQRRRKNPGMEQTASLDRIDSDKGYIEGNIQWVHKDVNIMKNQYPQERFIEICRLVTKTQENQSRTLISQPLDITAVMTSHLEGQYL